MIQKSRKAMTNYLLLQTRYTLSELNKLDLQTIEKWYREERQIEKKESMF
jgi:hypothetical protein